IAELARGGNLKTLGFYVIRAVAGIDRIRRAAWQRIEIGPLGAVLPLASVSGSSHIGLQAYRERRSCMSGEDPPSCHPASISFETPANEPGVGRVQVKLMTA